MLQTITARSLQLPSYTMEYPVLTVEDGRIVGMHPGEVNDSQDILTSAFFDIHVHGAVSHDFMSATLPEIDAVGCFLARKGVAHYLATTVTGAVDTTLRSLDRLGQYMQSEHHAEAAGMMGVNLEGPFICPAKRGVHPADRILAPSIELFERFQQAAQGTIRLTTIAPEMPGALELIEYATAQGVRVSLGHSNATYAQALAGVQAGAKGATHTFNAMRSIDHREPGLTGAVLDCEDLFAEAIVDKVHIHPAMVRLWFKAKGRGRAVLVTDGMAATGMPDGTYRLGDLVVEVKNGVCLSDGVLAGSVLTMDRAVGNVREITGATLPEAIRLASDNPADLLGVKELCEVKVGAAANLNIYDEKGRRLGMWLSGKRISA